MVLMVVLTVIFIYHQELALHFNFVVEYLSYLEQAISQLDSDYILVICILALFIAKTQLPIPLTFICIISGMVYSTRVAFLINMMAMIVEMSIKYVEGLFIGGGWAEKLLNIKKGKTDFIKKLIEFNGTGNPYILLGCRLIPFIPLNMLSRIYGSMKADYIYYICMSVIGLIPRVYTYTRIGRAVFNPFSAEFIILLMIVVLFMGATAIISNVFYGNKVNQINQLSLFVTEKQKYKITF